MAFNATLSAGTFASYISEIPSLVAQDLWTNLFDFGVYAFGMFLYVIMVWHFYRALAKRDTVDVNQFQLLIKHPMLHAIKNFLSFLVHSLVIFPIITFIWFLILGAFLLVLSRTHDVAQILLISMSIIAVSRITAYYNEDLAKDVAKLVPFALLGVFIVDPRYFELTDLIDKIKTVPFYLPQMLQYLITIVFLEFILRLIYRFKISVLDRY